MALSQIAPRHHARSSDVSKTAVCDVRGSSRPAAAHLETTSFVPPGSMRAGAGRVALVIDDPSWVLPVDPRPGGMSFGSGAGLLVSPAPDHGPDTMRHYRRLRSR